MQSSGFDRPLWQAWREMESIAGARLLERAFGHVGIEFDAGWMPQDLLPACPVRRRLRLAATDGRSADGWMEFDALGIASGSVDVAILPHTLEFVASPQATLREMERILVGEGHLLITGFNPWSAWPAARPFAPAQQRGLRMLSTQRLYDWLQLLGLEVVAVERFFRRPPVDIAGLLDRLRRMEEWRYLPIPGCGYAILARKRVVSMTPLRLRERRKESLGGLVRPAMMKTRTESRGNH